MSSYRGLNYHALMLSLSITQFPLNMALISTHYRSIEKWSSPFSFHLLTYIRQINMCRGIYNAFPDSPLLSCESPLSRMPYHLTENRRGNINLDILRCEIKMQFARRWLVVSRGVPQIRAYVKDGWWKVKWWERLPVCPSDRIRRFSTGPTSATLAQCWADVFFELGGAVLVAVVVLASSAPWRCTAVQTGELWLSWPQAL